MNRDSSSLPPSPRAAGPSRAGEVERLVDALRGGGAVQRDSAVARLRIIGGRAVERLINLISSDAPAHGRAAALRALEGLDDGRAREIALRAATDRDEAVATAAIGVLRVWVTRGDGIAVLDALSALALQTDRAAPVRLAALDALSDLPRHLVEPLLRQVPEHVDRFGVLDDPLAAREWLASHQQRASLSELHDFLMQARERERQETSARRREDWLVTRGAAHAALAQRDSRIALYDLRETFDAAQAPPPLDFLTALTIIGDVTCLEPMARAWAAAPTEAWWRGRVADAATDIMKRQKLTGRSGAVKRVRAKWPGFLK